MVVGGVGDGDPPKWRVGLVWLCVRGPGAQRKKENNKPSEGWEDGTPPPHRD